MTFGRLFVFLVFICGGMAQPLPSQAPFTTWLDHQLDYLSVPAREAGGAEQTAGSAPSIPGGPTVSVFGLQHNPSPRALAAFSRSQKLTKAGAWEQAARELEKAVTADPDFAGAHSNLGVCYFQLDRAEMAAAELRRAIELDPATGVYRSNLAVVLESLERWGEAEQEARTAVALDPANSRGQFVFGSLLARRAESRSMAAEHLIYAARELPEAHRLLAQIYRADGEDTLAAAEWKRYERSSAERKAKGTLPDKNYQLDTGEHLR
jgi:Tfp pilus assembly protein PilF